MNLSKIGKFISACRKNKKLTQEQLAEKLSITDRAVSKWERGLSLPDASLMLELCKILDINVNELLIGEKIEKKDEKNKVEELLLELAKQEEYKNKKLYLNMWISGITVVVFYISLVFLTIYTLEEISLCNIIIGAFTILFVLFCFYLVKMEIDTGYYECQKCHHKFIPSYVQATMMPHVITSRILKCPKCKKMGWSKKVMFK